MTEFSILVIDKHPEYLALVDQQITTALLGNKKPKLMQQISITGLEIALLSGDYDVAFIDYETVAGLCNGYVARWLKNICKKPNCSQIVVVSATGDELLAVKMILAGAADYLPKRLLSSRLIEVATKWALSSSTSSASKPGSKNVVHLQEPRRAKDFADLSSAEDATVIDLSQPIEPAITIDGYEITRELNKSRGTSLYLARSLERQELVVLKLVSLSGSNKHTRRRFEREYATASKINHPLVVDIYDFGVVDNHAYISMEFFPCGDLKNRMINPISPHQGLNYLRQIALALEQLHQQNIVHRDLKPANIMLREDNSIALIDFGIAITADSETITGTHEIHGTPYYISPERLSSQPVGHLCARGDLLRNAERRKTLYRGFTDGHPDPARQKPDPPVAAGTRILPGPRRPVSRQGSGRPLPGHLTNIQGDQSAAANRLTRNGILPVASAAADSSQGLSCRHQPAQNGVEKSSPHKRGSPNGGAAKASRWRGNDSSCASTRRKSNS